MKSILISIRPEWCEAIASGVKTVEVRKTRPKLETPFKVYIYETKKLYKPQGDNYLYQGQGKVIGEFVCDKVVMFKNEFYDYKFEETANLSCMDFGELGLYLGKNNFGFGWHISELVIYDKPKELSEFYRVCEREGDCNSYCPYLYFENTPNCYEIWCTVDGQIPIKRPPQSWCYTDGYSPEEVPT